MTHRKRPPFRRHSRNRTVKFGRWEWTVGIGYHDDGRPAEVFIDGPPKHTGSMLDRLTDDLAIALSLCLQLGVSPDKLARSFSTEPVWINGEEVEGHATIAGVVAELAAEEVPEIERITRLLETHKTGET